MLVKIIVALFLSVPSHGLDLNFRFKDGFCQKGGQPGTNPEFFGECGNITGSRVISKKYVDKNLKGMVFNSNYIYVTNFKGGDLTRASMRRSTILQSRFKDLTAESVDLRGSQIKGTHFENANLQKLAASGSRFNKVQFKNCDLQNAQFWGSQLLEVDFSGSDLRGANLGTSFTLLSKFNGAKFNKKTKLPFSEEEALKRGMVKND